VSLGPSFLLQPHGIVNVEMQGSGASPPSSWDVQQRIELLAKPTVIMHITANTAQNTSSGTVRCFKGWCFFVLAYFNQ
jgi:hypothetical protein